MGILGIGKRLVALQPVYLPWIGYFDQMRRSDLFVFFDDAQFDRHGWRNRNRIKSPTGARVWLTVPIRHQGLQRIIDVEIDNRQAWPRRHVGMVKAYYARSPFLKRYLPEFEHVLYSRWSRLADLDIAVIDLFRRWLGLETPIARNSELGVTGGRRELPLNFCQRVGATRYLTGNTARTYLDVDLLARHGIEVEWHDYAHPTYPQLHGGFVSHLSALDLVLNCGDESGSIMACQATTETRQSLE